MRTAIAVVSVAVGLLAAACGARGQPARVTIAPPASSASAGTSAPAIQAASPTTATAAPLWSTAPPTILDLPPGLLATATNGVAFLQWTQTGSSVAGSLTQVWTIIGSATPQHQVVDFTGVLSGDSVTLTLVAGESINGTSFLTGHFRDGQLTLTYPAPDGTIASLIFAPGTVADYNSAVAEFESAQAAQAPPSEAVAAAFECSLQVLGHDAFVGVNGPLGSFAWNGCLHIADVVTFTNANWGPVAAPAAAIPTNDSVVCGGLLKDVDDDHVIVFDSGGQSYGGLICNALPLTVAYLGVITQAVPGGLALVSAQAQNGTTLPAVVPGSPAARAGLQQGDIITSLDGMSVASIEDLTSILAYDSPGQTVQLTYLRRALLTTVAVVLATRPPGQ